MKIKVALCLSFAALLSAVGFCIHEKNKIVVLEFGMFVGSNWDVPNGDSYRMVDMAIKKFEKTHPKVKVHYYSGMRKNDYGEWIGEQVLKGKVPDVMIIPDDHFLKLVSMGVLEDLTKLLESDRRIKHWEYFDSAWNSGRIGGGQYGLPYETDFMLMTVNKTLLDSFGCSFPEKNWTWKDFYRICQTVTADKNGDGISETAGVCGYTWKEAVYSNGASLFDEDKAISNFGDTKIIEGVRFMQKLSELGKMNLFDSEDFENGKVAFMPMSFAKYRMYTSYPYKLNKDVNYQWHCTTMPSGPSGNNVSQLKTLLMGISSKTKHKKLAFDLLETFTHDSEIQTSLFRHSQGASALRMVYFSEEVTKLLEENLDSHDTRYSGGIIAQIMDSSILDSDFHIGVECLAMADNEINRIISEKKDAESYLSILQNSVNAILEK